MKIRQCYNRVLAFVLAVVVVITSIGPIKVVADEPKDSAKVEYKGGTLYYDGNGKKQDRWDDSVVAVTKEITKLEGKNEFQIDLAVKAKNEVKQVQKSEDAAVVLVLDASNSMKDKLDEKYMGSDSRSRITYAKDAAKKFLDSYVKNAGDAKRMVSVVQFGTNVSRITDFVDVSNATTLTRVKSMIDNNYKVNFQYSYNKYSTVELNKIVTRGRGEEKEWRCDYLGCKYTEWQKYYTKYERFLGGRKEIDPNASHTHTKVEKKTAQDNGGTNIEGGLQLARFIFENGANGALEDISNRSMILLSDGEPTSNITDWGDRITYLLGGDGYWTHKEDKDDAKPAVDEIKNLGGVPYTILYALNDRETKNWLQNDVGMKKVFEANDTNELNKAFENINETIDESYESSGLIVTDPMGPNFIKGFEAITTDENTTFDGTTLVWNPTVAKETKEGNITYREYMFSYKVKLDTEATGFIEGMSYDTNGRTTLQYKYGKSDTVRTVDFTIPQVSGTIPNVAYRVEYYKWNKTTEKYDESPTDTEGPHTAKLHTTVKAPDGYENKYASANYVFEKGDIEKQLTTTPENNVLKLYYKPIIGSVTVKHFYKTDVYSKDGTLTKGEYKENPDTTVENPGLYKGDEFSAILIEKAQDGVEYELDTEKSDKQTVTVTDGNQVINLYYSGVKDERSTTRVIVNAIYKTGKWELDTNGKWIETFTESAPEKKEDNKDLRAYTSYVVNVESYKEGYAYESSDNGIYDEKKKEISLKLEDKEENIINITYIKHADPNQYKKVTVDVTHKYYLTEKKIVGGKLETVVHEPITVENSIAGYKVGEKFKPSEEKTNGGKTYKSDVTNAGKLGEVTLTAEGYKVTLNYHLTEEPTPTKVTVNHIYVTRDKEYVEKLDDEKKGTGKFEVKDVEREDGRTSTTIESIDIDNNSEKLYPGFEYTATANGSYNGETYLLDTEKSTPDQKLTLVTDESENVINLFYYKDEDTRDKAEIKVLHQYIDRVTTVKNGEVVTEDTLSVTTVVDEEKDIYEGKAGDEFEATPQLKFEGHDYNMKEGQTLKVTLKPGTNETITIQYIREYSELKAATLTVLHKYFEKVMTVVNGVAGYFEEREMIEESTELKVNGGNDLPAEIYAGQKYTVDLRPNGYTPNAENPATEITLKEGANNLTLEYEKEIPLSTTTIKVNHHYTLTTIDAVGKKTVTTSDILGTSTTKYVGELEKVSAVSNGYNFKNVKVTEGTSYESVVNNGINVTMPEKDVIVDYYYERTVDNSVKASYEVKHFYRTLDWNESEDKEYKEDETKRSGGDSFATLNTTVTAETYGGTYNVDYATLNGTKLELGEGNSTSISLIKGDNVIKFYYTQRVDTRKETGVKVIHRYYKHDTSGLVAEAVAMNENDATATVPGVLAGEYEENISAKNEKDEWVAWVGKEYMAKLRTIYGVGEDALEYTFHSANPEDYSLILKEETDEARNVIVINYVYEYDASKDVEVTVEHIYKTINTNTNGETIDDTVTVTALFGNTESGIWNEKEKQFTAKELPRAGYTRVTKDSELTILYTIEGNKITIVYEKRVTPHIPTPGPTPGPLPDPIPTPTPDPNPGTEIEEPEVPLDPAPPAEEEGEDVDEGDDNEEENVIDIEDENVPLDEQPDKDIEDGETPLSDNPLTGDALPITWILLGVGAISGILALFLTKAKVRKMK